MPKEIIRDGPAAGRNASPAAAVRTVAKMPAPIIAPMPSSVTLTGPRVRFSVCPFSLAAARISSRFLLRNRPRSKVLSPQDGFQFRSRDLLPRSLRFQMGSFKLYETLGVLNVRGGIGN